MHRSQLFMCFPQCRYSYIQADKLGALANRVEALVGENEGLLQELQHYHQQQEQGQEQQEQQQGEEKRLLRMENAAMQEEAEAVGGLCTCACIR